MTCIRTYVYPFESDIMYVQIKNGDWMGFEEHVDENWNSEWI